MNRMLSLIALAFLIAPALSGESAIRTTFNGDWVGEIHVLDLKEIEGEEDLGDIEYFGTTDVRITITGNGATQYFKEDDGSWYPVTPDIELFDGERNNYVFIWINKGGVWTETQVFSMSFIDSSTLSLKWIRHVNNYRNGSANECWDLHGTGTLRKR